MSRIARSRILGCAGWQGREPRMPRTGKEPGPGMSGIARRTVTDGFAQSGIIGECRIVQDSINGKPGTCIGEVHGK